MTPKARIKFMMTRAANLQRKRPTLGNNRLNIIMAIIFLLAGLIIFKLFSLQIYQYDLYVALASNQQTFYDKLIPKRGQIFIQDNRNGNNNELFPLATNKDFGIVFAIPEKVTMPNDVATALYRILDEERIVKEVDDLLARDPYFANNSTSTINSAVSEKAEFRKVRRELEIKTRQEQQIQEYLKKLDKPNDLYEPIKSKVEGDKLAEIKNLNNPGLGYVIQSYRYYPGGNIGGQLIGFLGFKNDKNVGQYGLEGYFESELAGKPGEIKADKAAGGDLFIMNDDKNYSEPEDGYDLILTINRSLEYAACTKLREAVARHGADGGSVIIMEPTTGAILAICSVPDYDPNKYNEVKNINIYNNPAIFYQYEPGSIFKGITMAAGLDQAKISPETTYDDKGQVKITGWPTPIKNSDYEQSGGHGRTSMSTVLELSLNTGAIFVLNQIGDKTFADYVKNFGFGEKTGIELETEAAGNINVLTGKKIRPVEAATASFGQGITVTPLQMVVAYAAMANGGILMKPYLVKEMVKPNGERIITQPRPIRRVITERSAILLSGMLVNVIEKGHGKRGGVEGYYLAGKTGTAQVPKKGGGYEENAHIGSFCGFGPVDDPIFAMIVKIDNPRDVDWAESSAAPLFGEIAKFILDYYQIPPNR